jgi:hypothetical protein
VGATNIALSAAEVADIDAAFPLGSAVGTRYPENMMAGLGR